jgi:serine protease AprX
MKTRTSQETRTAQESMSQESRTSRHTRTLSRTRTSRKARALRQTRALRTRSRIYLYLLLVAFICVAIVMPVATRVSWSRSLNGEGNVGGTDVATRYEADSASMRDLKQLFLPAATAKVAPQVMEDTAGDQSASVVILLAEQADLSAAYAMTDQDARGWYVYNTLTKHAARTQAGLQSFLKAQGINFKSFWAANMLVATVSRPVIEVLAARADVARIDSNRPMRWIEDPSISNLQVTSSKPNIPEVAELGVMNVNAPAVWALGFTGQGIVIGDLDTGMRWTHNALKPRYRGWNGVTADHNYNWHDSIHSGGGSCGANTVAPCDDQGHGTHTAGTTVGDDGTGNQIGVAPGAKWIGCRNMDQGNGTPATYTECFQFTIAPTDLTGSNPNPSLRPHVLNNSWTCPASEGCTTRAELETIVQNTEAAGIFVEASAGNSGPGCSTVSDPPAIYSNSFSTGAINAADNSLASFSSRGPSTYYTPNLLKPNISAPGVTVRSSLRTSDTSFGTMSGTSMAGPHVVGVVALLWSARPTLSRNIAATKTILQNTANPSVTLAPTQTCGGTPSTQIPNNSFGYGRVDALAAVNAVPTAGQGSIAGTVTTSDGASVAGVTVSLTGARSARTITDSSGRYRFDGVDPGSFYSVTPDLVNYHFSPSSRSFSLVTNVADAVFTAAGDAVAVGNPLDSPEYFVRQHYLDFLGREPDQGGLDFWSGQLRACGSDLVCLNSRRTGVSAAFFVSQEFESSGLFVYDLYKGALGRSPLYAEYTDDRKQVVGGPALATEQATFAAGFVQRPEFVQRYPLTMPADVYVDALLSTAQQGSATDFSNQRLALINLYNSGASLNESRTLALRGLVESADFKQAQYNPAFVTMEYFGYLGRNPESAGFNFWLNILNQSSGNYSGMVCSFITSSEFQLHFAPVVTHSNTECGP